jgi:hypothetical protein
MDTLFQDLSATFPAFEQLDVITIIVVVFVIQFIRVTAIEYRLSNIVQKIQRHSVELNTETTMIESIGSKMDDLNDFIRNKVQLKKDK